MHNNDSIQNSELLVMDSHFLNPHSFVCFIVLSHLLFVCHYCLSNHSTQIVEKRTPHHFTAFESQKSHLENEIPHFSRGHGRRRHVSVEL